MIAMKKIIFAILAVIQAALLVGCVVFESLCKSKMGVMRHVLYTNSKWEKAYPVVPLKYVFGFALLLAAAAFAVFLFRALHQKRMGGLAFGRVLCFILLATGGACVILFASKEVWRSYYYISMVVLAIVAIQLPKAIDGLLSRNK